MKARFLALSLFTLLLLQACSGAAASGDAAVPVAGQASAGASSIDLSDPASFKEPPGNYEIDMAFTFDGTREDGSPAAGQIDVEGVRQLEPPASSYTFTASGDVSMAQGGVFQVVTIGDQSYFYTSQAGCITMGSIGSETPFDSLVDSGGMISNQAQRLLPDETVNGIPTFRYALTEENLDLSDPTSMDVEEITDGTLYLAQNGGYVVRLVMNGRGSSEVLTSDQALVGNIHYQIDFTPVTSVGEITPPSGCEAAEVSTGEFPMMADASMVASYEGFMTYQTTASVEDITAFYKVEMVAAGWTLEEENSIGNISALRFTQSGRVVSVIITFTEALNATSVVIGEE